MAVILSAKRDTFDVILSFDSALAVTDEEWKQYAETLDEGHLRFKPGQEPTRFVMKQILPYGSAKRVLNEQATYVDNKLQVNLSYMTEEVKAALCDIKNPADVPEESRIKFEKDKDGTASEKLMELLMASGVVNELFAARQVKVAANSGANKKK